MFKDVTVATFTSEVLEEKSPVLVDFWASWCNPCRMLSPILEAVAQERDDVKIVKIDIDANPELAQRYQIFSIPNLVLFKDNEAVGQIVGLKSKNALMSDLDKLLLNAN